MLKVADILDELAASIFRVHWVYELNQTEINIENIISVARYSPISSVYSFQA